MYFFQEEDTFVNFPKRFLPWKTFFPTVENKISKVGKFLFQGWKLYFPTEESFNPKGGPKKSLGREQVVPRKGFLFP